MGLKGSAVAQLPYYSSYGALVQAAWLASYRNVAPTELFDSQH
ncbi:hypothetical protein [Marivirga harenae]|nr:hypothetical protein [Marivirga harenae]WKV11438.1 hypothetical protein Q3Y49_14625 [Marivirga harenae]